MGIELGAIELALNDIKAKLPSNPLFARAGGAPPDDADIATAVRELDKLRAKLGSYRPHLENRGKSLEWTREQATWEVREHRFRAIQSANDRLANLRRVQQLADSVLALIDQLLAKSATINFAEAIASAGNNKIEKIVEAKAKGEPVKQDAVVAAEQLGITIVMIAAIISRVIEMARRSAQS